MVHIKQEEEEENYKGEDIEEVKCNIGKYKIE